MFGFRKKPPQPPSEAPSSAPVAAAPPPAPEKKGLFARLKDGLARTRDHIVGGLASLVRSRRAIDDDLLEELETRLLTADLGVEATQRIIARLQERMRRQQLPDADALFAALREDMRELLAPCVQPLAINAGARPYVILAVGVNGVGKTTTIGKLAKRLQADGHSVMLAAGDTFRAAAVEQLEIWGQRNGVTVVAQKGGADAASVIFDALQSARARGIDVLIADTAGRLHTQGHLMDELRKIHRVIGKFDASAPHEVLLVLDATNGQNALMQAVQFHEAVGVSGLCLTKLDGTARGGILFAIAQRLGLPVRFVGVGEKLDDLRDFDAADFVDALVGTPDEAGNDENTASGARLSGE